MELQEEEFDVSNLLEDVVDFHHPLGMEKGVDLVLDPCDGSVIRYSRVKGDRVKLKQVLCNLISNAVKFTDEGHVTVRAWVQKQMQHDTRSMDFMFEVDDTGKGIPKEKYISVFENYVQVKETGSGQGGTGLGLGIVKSLVHLMHGDIGIMDKDIGEKGTCFRFNVHLTLSDSETMLNYGSSAISKEDLEYGPSDMNQANTSVAASNICSISPRLHVCSFSSRPEASQVILLLANEERRRTSQRFMESLEIKVKVVKQWKNLFDTLIKIKGHNSDGQCSPIESSDSSCWSTPHDSFLKARGVPMAGVKYMMSSVLKKTGNGAAPGFILIVIDANAGRFSELYRIVSNFKKELPNPCKVVWLDNPLQRSINSKAIDENDDVISKPFHGSHLFQVIKLLPEYGGALESRSSKAKTEGTLHVCSKAPVHQGETQECGDSSNRKPLSGRNFLLVEDNKLARKVAKATLERLGATIDECENGKHAVRLVYECLNQKSPYDYILMDCHMPDMDGFQATRRIREMEMEMEKEKSYVVPIPIIALTGLTENITAEAGNGIDFHIVKPINRENLLEAIRHIHTRKSGIK
ncbi:histidine kinase CKI1-like isoform X1 [Lotus japonicus]|uniref:histidine kinase CKI1-like isoform X1 n=1 Tax=Lotus japonicus TaxID=34305 RepID=UPI0025830CEC|nr:histidine kinase CKI1-like isoform X1 [Lotus japonicus]